MATTPPNATSSKPTSGSSKPAPSANPTSPAARFAGINPAAAPLHGPLGSPMGRVPTPAGIRNPAAGRPLGKAATRRRGTPWLTFSAFVLTMLWFGIVGFYVIKAGGFTSFLESSGAAAIVAVTGLMLAPAALFWMVFAYLKRASDVESALEPLIRQLSLVTGQGGVAESRVRRFNDALTEQLALLKETGVVSTKTAQLALATLNEERTALESSQSSFAGQIDALVSTLRAQSGQLETLVDSGQEQFNRVATTAREASAALAGETHDIETRIMALVEKASGKFNATFTQLDREQTEHLNNYATISHDLSQTLKGDSTEIEGRLGALLNSLNVTLEELDRVTTDRLTSANETSFEIANREKNLRAEAAIVTAELAESADSILDATSRFKELSASSRAEAERLLVALGDQTRTLDTHAIEARDRLEATRSLIAVAIADLETSANRLSGVGETVNMSVDSRIAALGDAATALDSTAAKITAQLDTQLTGYSDKQGQIETLYSSVLERLRTESQSLTHAAEKIAAEADNSAARIAGSVSELTATTQQSFDSYSAISAKADAQATAVADNFNGAIDRYAGTARQLNVAAAELQQLATRCEETIVTMETTLGERAGMLDQVGERMAGTSRSVKDDAIGLVTTLQQLTDRLETVRAAATQTSDQTVLRLTDVAGIAGRNLSSIDQLAASTLNRLESASAEISQHQASIATQVDAIQDRLSQVSDGLSSRIANVLSQVERSSQTANDMVEGFLTNARTLAPAIASVAAEATEGALAAANTISTETRNFGDRVVMEKTRWNALIEEQARAFGDTLRDLDGQMNALREVNMELDTGAQRATERLLSHNTTIVDLENRLTSTGASQTAHLNDVRGEIEKIIDHLQKQTLALTSVTQQAVEGVLGATQQFGNEARTLGEISRQTESQVVSAADRMGEARTTSLSTRDDVYALRTEIEQLLERLNAQTEQLDNTRGRSREAAAELTAQTGQATMQLGSLTAGLDEALERATVARASAFVQLDDVASRVRGEADALTTVIGETYERLTSKASEATAAISSGLDSSLDAMRIQLEGITAEVTSLATSATKGIGNATVVLRAQVADQLAAIDAQTEQTLSQIGDRAEVSAAQITRAGEAYAEIGQQTEAQFARALGQISATDATLNQLASHAGTMRQQLVDESETMIATLDRMTQDLTSQMGRLRGTSETGLQQASADTEALRALLDESTAQLVQSSQQLQGVSASAGTYLSGLGAQLETQVSLVRETSGELSALTRETATGETQLTERLGNLMGQVNRARGDLAALDMQLADQSTRLSAQQQDALSQLSQTLSSLEQIGSRITAASADALVSADAVETRYESVATQAAEIVSRHTVSLEAAIVRSAANIADLAETIQQTGAEQARTFDAQQQQLSSLYGSLRAESATSADTLATLADRITAAGVATGSSAQQIIERLDTVAQTLIGEFATVTGAAGEAATALLGESQSFQAASAEIGLSARTAAGETGAAVATLREQTGAVQAAMASQLADTIGTLAAAQEKYEALNDKLAQQSESAETLLATVGNRFESLLNVAQSTMVQLRQEMEGFTAATASTLDQSGQQMQAQGSAFDAFGSRLSALVEQLGSGAAQALGDLRGVTSQLEVTRDRTLQIASETGQSLLGTVASLESQQQQLADSASTVFDSIIASGAAAGEKFVEKLEATRERSVQLARSTSDSLLTAAATLEAQQQELFSNANTVLESIVASGATAGEKLVETLEASRERTVEIARSTGESLLDAATILETRQKQMAISTASALDSITQSGTDNSQAIIEALDMQQQQLASRAGAVIDSIVQSGSTAGDRIVETLEATRARTIQITSEGSDSLLEAMAALEAQQQQLTNRASAAIDSIVQSGSTAGDRIVETLEGARDRTIQVVNESESALMAATAMLEARQERLVNSTSDAMGRIVNAGSDAAEQLAAQQEALLGSADQLAARVSEAGQKASEITAQLQQASNVASGAEDIFAALSQRGAQLRQSLTSDVTAMETALENAQAALETAGGTLARHTQETTSALFTIESNAEQSVASLTQASEQYRAEQKQIALAAEATLAETARILAGFQGFKTELQNQVSSLTQELSSATGQIERQSAVYAELGESHASLRGETERSLQTLAAAARQVSHYASDTHSDLTSVADRMNAIRGAAANALTGEIAELKTLIDGATGLINDLGRQLETQVSAVTDAGSALAHVSGSVNDNTAAALSRLQTLNQRLEAAKMSATLATETAARRVADILASVDDDDSQSDTRGGSKASNY